VGIVVGVDAGVDENVAVLVDVGVDVSISVGVKDEVFVKVGETGMMTTVDVAVGMNWGVGERIAGRGDGHATGVAIARGMYPPLQDASKRINTVARIILVILFLQSLSFYRKFQ